MKKLVNNETELVLGPFESIEIIDNGYNCDSTIYQYTVVGECVIEEWVGPIPEPVIDCSTQNKAQAESLLQSTDWTATVDIANPQYSNPYLANQDEFLQYRSTVRAVAVNPPSESVSFPPVPKEIWATV